MVKVFIDTNVLIDLLVPSRKGYNCATELFTLVFDSNIEAAISTQSILDAIYAGQKYPEVDMASLRTKLENLTLKTNIGQVNSFDVRSALRNPNPDIEDSAHISFAYDQVCDFFITNDQKLLNRKLPSPLKAMTPEQFVNCCKA